jgi:hypothetical protein
VSAVNAAAAVREYGGLEFDAATHTYAADGIPFDGVTTVIGSVIRKPGLEHWIGDVGNREAKRIRKEAASHGTLVHGLAALVVQGLPSIPMGDEGPTQAQMDAFTDWYEHYVEAVHAVELPVANFAYRYAGTLDLLVRLKGDKRPTLVDIKSGKALWPEMRYQTGGYRGALLASIQLRELGYTRKDCRRGVLHIPQDIVGPARLHEHTRHASDLQGFLSCLFLYRDLKRGI